MPVSQQFINLLNLPKEQLQKIAVELDVEIPAGARKWDIVRLLSMQPTRELAPRAADWIFAGKTSVTYVRLGDGSPLKREAVTNALTELLDGVNPFESDIRPDALSSKPALVDAAEVEGRIFLSFGVKKRVAEVLSDFEITPIHGDEFFVVVIRPEAAILEVRTNNQRAQRFTTTWVAEFADLLDAEQPMEAGAA